MRPAAWSRLPKWGSVLHGARARPRIMLAFLVDRAAARRSGRRLAAGGTLCHRLMPRAADTSAIGRDRGARRVPSRRPSARGSGRGGGQVKAIRSRRGPGCARGDAALDLGQHGLARRVESQAARPTHIVMTEGRLQSARVEVRLTPPRWRLDLLATDSVNGCPNGSATNRTFRQASGPQMQAGKNSRTSEPTRPQPLTFRLSLRRAQVLLTILSTPQPGGQGSERPPDPHRGHHRGRGPRAAGRRGGQVRGLGGIEGDHGGGADGGAAPLAGAGQDVRAVVFCLHTPRAVAQVLALECALRPARRHPELVPHESPAAAVQDGRTPHPACPVLHPATRRKLLDTAPVPADRGAHRAPHVAPHVSESRTSGAGALGCRGRGSGGVPVLGSVLTPRVLSRGRGRYVRRENDVRYHAEKDDRAERGGDPSIPRDDRGRTSAHIGNPG
jgi:hypothetical protein